MHKPVTATTSAIDRDTTRPRAIDLRRPPDPPGLRPRDRSSHRAANRDELGRTLIGVFARHGVRL